VGGWGGRVNKGSNNNLLKDAACLCSFHHIITAAWSCHVIPRHSPASSLPACPRREIIKDEETTFSRTLVKGLEQFHKYAEGAKGGKLAGADAFMLWDTYGFPVDLTEVGGWVGGRLGRVYMGGC
jgi:hypothetical protein